MPAETEESAEPEPEPTMAMEIDTDPPPPPSWQPPCPVCGWRKRLGPSISAVRLNAIRVLSKSMRDNVDALLKASGLQLPEPGDEGAAPLLIKCCMRCFQIAHQAKQRAQKELSWSRHFDDGLYPKYTTRVNGKRVQAFVAKHGDESFVFKADGQTAKVLLDKYNQGKVEVTASTLGGVDFAFQKGDRVWFPSLTRPGLRPHPEGFGRVVAARRGNGKTAQEEYSIEPEAPGEAVQVRVGTSLHRVTEEGSSRPLKRRCVKKHVKPVDVGKLVKDNKKALETNEKLTAEIARLQANLYAQERRAASSAARAKEDRKRLTSALETIAELQSTLTATIERASQSALELTEEGRIAGEEEANALAEQKLDALRKRLLEEKRANRAERSKFKSELRQAAIHAASLHRTVNELLDDTERTVRVEERKRAEDEITIVETARREMEKENKAARLAMEKENKAAAARAVDARKHLVSALRHQLECQRKFELAERAKSTMQNRLRRTTEALDAAQQHLKEQEEQEEDAHAERKSEPTCSALLALLNQHLASDVHAATIRRIDGLPDSKAVLNPTSRTARALKTFVSRVLCGLVGLLAGDDECSEPRRQLALETVAAAAQKLSTQPAPAASVLTTEMVIGAQTLTNLRSAFALFRSSGQLSKATQILSLLPGGKTGIPWETVRKIMTTRRDIAVGDPVVVTRNGQRLFARCVTVPSDPWASGAKYCVAPPEAPWSLPKGVRKTCGESLAAEPRNIRHAADVACTEHDTRLAAQHQALRFPGACADAPRRRCYVERASPLEREVIISVFSDPAFMTLADGGKKNAGLGIRYLLKLAWPDMLKEVNRRLGLHGHKPMAMQTLRRRVGGAFQVLKGDNCCCTTCKYFGWVTYDALRDLVRELYGRLDGLCSSQSDEELTRLLRRIDVEQRFRRTSFQHHLRTGSSCASHCLNRLLSTENQPEFHCACSHPRRDHRNPPPLPRAKDLGVEPKLECTFCAGTAGEVDGKRQNRPCTTCQFCGEVSHKSCAQHWAGDFADHRTWTCPSCSAESDLRLHDERCYQCERHDAIIEDVGFLVDQVSKLRPSEPGVAKDTAEFAEFATTRLTEMARDLLFYHAHLIRTTNQERYKRVCRDLLGSGSFVYALADYWAKQGEHQLHTANCENGKGNRTVSVYGQYMLYSNPSKEQREKYSTVQWDQWPPPPDHPETPGPTLIIENYRVFSDSSSQNTDHTTQTREAVNDRFRRDRPFLGDVEVWFQSDGASNFQCTMAALSLLTSQSVTVVCISTEGEGKGAVDADNGVAQHAIRASQRTLGCAADFAGACEDRRCAGQINAIFEPRPSDVTGCRGKTIPNMADMKMWALERDGSGNPVGITLWESFDAAASMRAGRPLGRGPGRFISMQDAINVYGLDPQAVQLPSIRSIAHTPPEGGDPLVNPAGKLSRQQAELVEEAKQARKRSRSAAQAAEEQARLAEEAKVRKRTLGDLDWQPRACECCAKLFRCKRQYEAHVVQGGCTTPVQSRKPVKRRQQQQRSIAAGIDNAVLSSLPGVDLVTRFLDEENKPEVLTVAIKASNEGVGFEVAPSRVHEDGSCTMPWPKYAAQLESGSDWKALDEFMPFDGTTSFAHLPAHLIFEGPKSNRSYTRSLMGFDWRSARAVGTLTHSRKGRGKHSKWTFHCVWPEEHDVDDLGAALQRFSQWRAHTKWMRVPGGINPEWDVSMLPARVSGVTAGSLAARRLVRPGLFLVAVGERPVRTLGQAQEALRQATPGSTVTLAFVRPRPQPTTRGYGRRASHQKYRDGLHDDVKAMVAKLSEDPGLVGRTRAIYQRLVAECRYQCTGIDRTHMSLLPPERCIRGLVIRIMKEKKKQARESAAAPGDAESDEGTGSEDEDSDDEVDGEGQDAGTSPERGPGGAANPVANLVVGSAIARYFDDMRRTFVGIVVRIVQRFDSSREFTVVYPEDLDIEDALSEDAMSDVTVEPEFQNDPPRLNQLRAVSNKSILELQAALGDELGKVREVDLPLDLETLRGMYGTQRHGLWFHTKKALVLRVLRLRLVDRIFESLGRNSDS